MIAIEHDPFIRVVAMNADGAREFCVNEFGMDPTRIDRIEDGGLASPRDRYKTGARTWHVYTRNVERELIKLFPHKSYRLTRDVINPNPDRRQKHDWRAAEVWKVGKRFYAQTRSFAHGSALDEIEGLSDEAKARLREKESEIWIYTGQYSHQDIGPRDERYASIVAALEPVDDFDALMHEIRTEHNVTPAEVLEYMLANANALASGLLARADVYNAAFEVAQLQTREAVDEGVALAHDAAVEGDR
jgi:hypothetical protein